MNDRRQLLDRIIPGKYVGPDWLTKILVWRTKNRLSNFFLHCNSMIWNILIYKLHLTSEISVSKLMLIFGILSNMVSFGWQIQKYICTILCQKVSLKTFELVRKTKIKVCQRKDITFSFLLLSKSLVTNWLLLPFVKSTHYLPMCHLKEGEIWRTQCCDKNGEG